MVLTNNDVRGSDNSRNVNDVRYFFVISVSFIAVTMITLYSSGYIGRPGSIYTSSDVVSLSVTDEDPLTPDVTSGATYIHWGWRAQIARELSMWSTISAAEFQLSETTLMEGRFVGVRIVLLKGHVYYKVLKPSPNPIVGHATYYTLSTLFSLKKLVWYAHTYNWTLPASGVVVHIQYGDGCTLFEKHPMPLFGYNNAPGILSHHVDRCKYVVSFPSYDWWWPDQDFVPNSPGRLDRVPRIPWSDKREVLLFRGHLNSWDDMRISVLWASLQYADYVDGKLVGEMDLDTCHQILNTETISGQNRPSEINLGPNCSNVIGDFKTPSDFAHYKYWLDVDGWGATFRLKNYLHGEAVVFKVESEYYQHFHASLQPWVHYIPVSKERFTTNIKERVAWAREHDSECRAIVRRAQLWAKTYLTHEQTAWYQKEVLSQVATKLSFIPSTTDMEVICCSHFDAARNASIWGGSGYICEDVTPCTSRVTLDDLKQLDQE